MVRTLASTIFAVALAVATVVFAAPQASAQCNEVVSGLREPLGTALTNQGNLLVSETGTTAPNSGRISIVDASGNRRTLLDVQFSANAEKTTSGFTLTAANQLALANGQTVTLSGPGGDNVRIRLVADFPNFIPFPLPFFPPNVKLSNPFQLVAVEDDLYVTDGGRNLVWHVDLLTGSFSELVA